MSTYSATDERGVGWLVFAATILGIAGIFNVIDGIVALSKSSFYVAGARYIFSDLRTWGWIVLIIGIAEILAAFAILARAQWARWFGMVIAGLAAIAQFGFIQAYPFWSITIIAVCIFAIYGLAVYGGREPAS
ncbi:MAG TPA: hypothetical protein VMT74_04390 [Gaiellaceae bacterium]|nr:hypothetical protein [Gaiellaceae bacterium]